MPWIKFDIEEWAEQEHALIEEFVDDWQEKNSENPEKWPVALSAGEWDEQFRVWHDDSEQKTPEED